MKRKLINYLKNGENSVTIFDCEKSKVRHLNTEYSTNNFSPFENERHFGKLISSSSSKAEFPKLKVELKSPTRQPYLTERTLLSPLNDVPTLSLITF
jgi:hypothetical protein